LEGNKVNAKRKARFGQWKKVKYEPIMPDKLRRQMEIAWV
jgi:hypothetical protein